jgi:Cytochrome c5
MSKEGDRAFMTRFGVILGLLVGSAVVLAVVSWLISLQEPKLQDYHQKQVAARLQPAGQVATAGSSATPASSAPAAASSAPAASEEASATAAASATTAATGGTETASAASAKSGSQIVTQLCASCHATGVLGAPKIGDTADWKARLAKAGGVAGLDKNAISGIGNMPPKGGNPDLSDAEVKAAVADLLKTAHVSP